MRLLFLLSVCTALLIGVSQAQDVNAGASVFKKCAACHSIGPGATNKLGPELNGLIDRPAGSIDTFMYSTAMKNSGLTWDEATLTTYLKAPKNLVPGTKMTFIGLSKDEDIANVVAYLAQFNADGSQKPPQ